MEVNAVSYLDIAVARGVEARRGMLHVAGFADKVGVKFFTKCGRCDKTLAPAEAYPTRSGGVRCGSHVDFDGFSSEAEYAASGR